MAAGTRKPLNKAPAFWDTSALVPLFVGQANSARVIELYREHDVVIWWATPIEIISALARLLRLREISTADFIKARKSANDLFASWSVIVPSDRLRATAVELVEKYDLRAADSLQLAAGLQWCGQVPLHRLFLTGDRRLQDAALLSGFDAMLI
jgi:predicted nucleic acid-binding protein